MQHRRPNLQMFIEIQRQLMRYRHPNNENIGKIDKGKIIIGVLSPHLNQHILKDLIFMLFILC